MQTHIQIYSNQFSSLRIKYKTLVTYTYLTIHSQISVFQIAVLSNHISGSSRHTDHRAQLRCEYGIGIISIY